MITATTRILLVDDFDLVRMMLRRQLNELGITSMEEARNGDEALAKLKEAVSAGKPFGAMFLDWNMPNKSGIEVLEVCRATREFEKLPIIMVTAENETEFVLKALVTGATDYIVKPFSPAILGAKIKHINDMIAKAG